MSSSRTSRAATAPTATGSGSASIPRSLVEGDRLQLGTSVLLWFTYVPSSVEPITISGRDIAIAKHVQTSLLPRKLDVEGLEVSASMVPAAEVGATTTT